MPGAPDLADLILADVAREQRESGALSWVRPVPGNVLPAKTGPAPRSVVEMTPVGQMELGEIAAELRWFQPQTAADAWLSEEIKERRSALWQRLDAAVLPGWRARWKCEP